MKKIFLGFFLSTFLIVSAQETKVSIYGFVRNDFFYNSRVNVEAFDGIFNILPRPIELVDGKDKNEQPQAEMLSIISRFGLNITGPELFGAKSSAKIESDFAGTGSTYFLMRIRQAYTQLNWEKSELVIGQAWHPMSWNVVPTVAAVNLGAPFQPFSRTPQLRYKQMLGKEFSVTAAALYQMQYMSQGPSGSTNAYQKHSLLPSMFLGFEHKNKHWLSGIGLDHKTIIPKENKLQSTSLVGYSQYQNKTFVARAKAVYGQNLSDLLMLGGYGLSNEGENTYTNFNTFSTWANIMFGNKFQYGIFAGYMRNLGTNKELKANILGNYTAYGFGYFDNSQSLVDKMVRIVPTCTYTIKNFKIGLEYDLTVATYGRLQKDGRVANPYNVNNHRIAAYTAFSF